MEDSTKEKNIINYPIPVSEESTIQILKQMQKSICKIYIKGGGYGTGFFCNIPNNNNNIPVLITNYHIINENYIKNNKKIIITLNNDKKEEIIMLNEGNHIYTNEKYDTVIIEIKNLKKNDNIEFMDLDEKLFLNNTQNIYEKTSAYIIQYPNNKLSVSYGIINNLDEFNIFHLCSTDKGSSGSPILNSLNNKIIGIHKEGSINFNYNKGTLLKIPINEFIREHTVKSLLGRNYFKNSNIITNKEDSAFILTSLLKKIDLNSSELLYTATKDGKTCKDFKEKCNFKGATLLVVKTKNNEILGGFTKCNWTNENMKHSKDEDAFLYSITNKKIFEVLKPEKAIINYNEGYAFASFGNTNDWDGLYFGDQNDNIYGYNNPKKLTDIFNILDPKELCSEKYFEVVEMEVYKIK